MKFIYPSFLWILLALIIPLIIHLFNFRRYKKVYFTNVRFLKEVKEEKSYLENIKRWLILLSRMLALAFLIFAFAQPYLSKNEAVSGGKKAISIYVDNSFSMDLVKNNISMLDLAKQRAEEVAKAFSSTDQFQLITNNLSAKHKRWLDQEGFINALNEVQSYSSNPTIENIQNIQKSSFEKNDAEEHISILISDFQKSAVGALQAFPNIKTKLIPIQASNTRNLFIDSCWLISPIQILNNNNRLAVRIRNSGDINLENIRLSLRINDEIKSIKDFNIKSNSYKIDTITFYITSDGWQSGQLSITDYPVNFDDEFYFTFHIAKNLNVLEITNASSEAYIKAIFNKDPYIKIQSLNVNRLNYEEFGQKDLIILNEIKQFTSGLESALKQYLLQGGSIYIIPSTNITSLNNLLLSLKSGSLGNLIKENNDVFKINGQEPIFKSVFNKIPRNIDLPKVKQYFPIQTSNWKEIPLLKLKNDFSLISKFKMGNGKIYLQAVPLKAAYSNLANHAIYPPMVYNLAVFSNDISSIYYTLGQKQSIPINIKNVTAQEVVKLRSGTFEYIPRQKRVENRLILSLSEEIQDANNYIITSENEKTIHQLALNYNRNESFLDFYTPNELTQNFKHEQIEILNNQDIKLSQQIKQIGKGRTLWKLCLILALVFLAAETLLIRFFPS